MKTELITLRQTLFYLRTKSPIKSKIEVIKWFLFRIPVRIILDFKSMKRRLRNIENKEIFSRMHDGATIIHTIEQLSNLYEIYGIRRQERFKFDDKPLYIIDIGAHIGIYTIKMALENPHSLIYSIEPEEKNFKKLRKNLRINKIKNVVPLRLALSNKEGYINLYIDEFGSGQHSLFKKTKYYEKIRVTTLDKLIRRLNLKSISLIKIDTEGAEYYILLGGIKSLKIFKPNLIIETHPWNDKGCNERIVRLLRKIGYNLKIFKEKDSSLNIYAWKGYYDQAKEGDWKLLTLTISI
jgi:FkbM family methyltransferase